MPYQLLDQLKGSDDGKQLISIYEFTALPVCNTSLMPIRMTL